MFALENHNDAMLTNQSYTIRVPLTRKYARRQVSVVALTFFTLQANVDRLTMVYTSVSEAFAVFFVFSKSHSRTSVRPVSTANMAGVCS